MIRRLHPAALVVLFVFCNGFTSSLSAEQLFAGAAKVDITDYDAGPVNDPLHVRVLVLKAGETKIILLALDAVAIGEIGYIGNDYLPKVREQLKFQFAVEPQHVLANASHCHGVVCKDVAERTIQAVEQAMAELVPVRVGVGEGHEDRISENRRLILKSGREADVRHAYALPVDEEVASVGPIDSQIGLLKLDREDGSTLAVVYNFACHPIQGVAAGGNTADITGFASKVIEENLGSEAVALFVQGCGGDINPVFYKDVDHPRDAESLGNMLGLSALKGLRGVATKNEPKVKYIHEMLTLPRGDRTEKIAELESKQRQLLQSLQGTSLNLKTYLPLTVKYHLSEEFPSYYSHRYLHDEALGRRDLQRLDDENRRNLQAYTQNILVMEELTRLQTNLKLLQKHQTSMVASGKRTIDVEVTGLRVGEFRLITFPGELTVRIGLGLKERAPHKHTFIAGYTNGYIYYAPTAEQLMNVGGAQEDSDCILAPEWQEIFEAKVLEILGAIE